MAENVLMGPVVDGAMLTRTPAKMKTLITGSLYPPLPASQQHLVLAMVTQISLDMVDLVETSAMLTSILTVQTFTLSMGG